MDKRIKEALEATRRQIHATQEAQAMLFGARELMNASVRVLRASGTNRKAFNLTLALMRHSSDIDLIYTRLAELADELSKAETNVLMEDK